MGSTIRDRVACLQDVDSLMSELSTNKIDVNKYERRIHANLWGERGTPLVDLYRQLATAKKLEEHRRRECSDRSPS